LGGTEAIGLQQGVHLFTVRVGEGSGLLQRVPTVSISNAGSLDTTQWNFVMDWLTWFAAKEKLILQNHACGELS
jgi:hypothetical protein